MQDIDNQRFGMDEDTDGIQLIRKLELQVMKLPWSRFPWSSSPQESRPGNPATQQPAMDRLHLISIRELIAGSWPASGPPLAPPLPGIGEWRQSQPCVPACFLLLQIDRQFPFADKFGFMQF